MISVTTLVTLAQLSKEFIDLYTESMSVKIEYLKKVEVIDLVKAKENSLVLETAIRGSVIETKIKEIKSLLLETEGEK